MKLMLCCCQASRGDRAGARNIVILVSDGDANIAADETISEAVRLKNDAQAVIKVLTIGQPSFINFDVLRSVVSRPSASNIIHATSFNALSNITDEVVNATCNGSSTVQSSDYNPAE